MSKHSLHAEAEALSNLETGSSVPAFRTIESRRPKWLIVSSMAVFAIDSSVMSHLIMWREADGSDSRSLDELRERTMTRAE
jgi:hypothetical protein